jgi:hypothetical protein
VDHRDDFGLKAVGKKFCDDLDDTIYKRNGPEIVYTCRILDFGNQCDEGAVYGFKIQGSIEEVKT